MVEISVKLMGILNILNQPTEVRGTAGVQGLCLQTRPADSGRSCQKRRLPTLPPARTLTLDLGSRQSILLGQPRDAPTGGGECPNPDCQTGWAVVVKDYESLMANEDIK